ncbi:hypothetical protein [Adhaeretor mobilis]|uniref:Type II toxin-antitoxin system RelE/ParE family toxin n=1 Tax=Adhaeretor mobilis TaxID=1930276 RepID=A0A517N0L5_9BACT|nr:hypothetical protein [Adhaeretor mobilis]QDT00680.1 hypothetical protein HG15A2_40190 [Adhaeretor mobilis]
MKWELTPRVLDDADRAAAWYESRRTGLGSELLDEFEFAIFEVIKSPKLYPLLEQPENIKGRARRFLLPRFPYVLIYAMDGVELAFLTLQNTASDPENWLR